MAYPVQARVLTAAVDFDQALLTQLPKFEVSWVLQSGISDVVVEGDLLPSLGQEVWLPSCFGVREQQRVLQRLIGRVQNVQESGGFIRFLLNSCASVG